MNIPLFREAVDNLGGGGASEAAMAESTHQNIPGRSESENAYT